MARLTRDSSTRALWHVLHTLLGAACLLCVTTAHAAPPSKQTPTGPATKPAEDSPRGPRPSHVGVEVLVYFPDVADPGIGTGIHGRHRLGSDLLLVGASFTHVNTMFQSDWCRDHHCFKRRGAVTVDAELHILDGTRLPVLDPYIGVGLGPAWSSGDLSPETRATSGDAPGTTFGAAYDVNVGLDLHLWYAALGLVYRMGHMNDTSYAAFGARFQARF